MPFLALLVFTFSPFGARADETGNSMADTARRLVASLDEKQKAQATFGFDSPERFNWHWIPRERKGLPIKDLKPEQRALAFGLLNTGLSTKGVLKATTIMSLEEILHLRSTAPAPFATRSFTSSASSAIPTTGPNGDGGSRDTTCR